MGSSKRNHYVPRFLLRRFASRTQRNGQKTKYWTWQYRGEGGPQEISITDAAVASWFYGGQSESLEEELRRVEGDQNLLLEALEGGDDPNAHSEALTHLVWIFGIRTRATREQFSEAGVAMMEALRRTVPDRAAGAVAHHIDEQFDDVLDGLLSRLPPGLREQVEGAIDRSALRKAMLEYSRTPAFEEECVSTFRTSIEMMSEPSVLQQAATDGHLGGIAQLLGGNRPKAEIFQPETWSLLRLPDHSLILGDNAVVALADDGRVASLLGAGGDWREVYFPIAHNALLIAHPGESGEPSLSVREVNAASVQLSQHAFFSSQERDELLELASCIASGAPALSEEQFERIARDAWDGEQS